MQLEFLGSGGAITIPRPGCECRVCAGARRWGIPFSRSGPGLFVHGPDVLIDTSEEIKEQLNRSHVGRIEGCFYSHWHPDHVLGRRVWEARNADLTHRPPKNLMTTIYLPRYVAEDFDTKMGTADHLSFMEKQGWVKVVKLSDEETVQLNGVVIRPFQLPEGYVYGFMFEAEDKHVLIAPDELNGWSPPDDWQGVDLAVVPMGICAFHPLTGERRVAEDHPVLAEESTFTDTLAMIRQLQAKRVIITHIDEPDGVTYTDLKQLEKQLQKDGLPITFAYDTMMVDI